MKNFLHFFGVLKALKSRGTKMSANSELITVGTYVQQGKTINNQFFIDGSECYVLNIFGYLVCVWGGGGFKD